MIYQLSLTFHKDREIYIPTKKKMIYVVVYCGSTLYSIILKRVVEEIFNITQLFTHYLSQFQLNLHILLLHIKIYIYIKKKSGRSGGASAPSRPPLTPPLP